MSTNIVPLTWGAAPADWVHFASGLGLTADLLPVVSNTGAKISERSTMKDLGRVPSRYNGEGHAVGFSNWTQRQASDEDVDAWARQRDYGICIQTRVVRAIDIDVPDPVQADAISQAIIDTVGQLPMRFRANSGKRLMAFTLPGDFTKRKFTTTGGIVEFLATGQQFIAVGTHPSGVRYEWAGGLPDEIPVLEASQFEELWAALVSVFATEESTEQSPSVKREKLAAVVQADPVAVYLRDGTSIVKQVERDGRMHIECPFSSDHTSDSSVSATTYFPAHTGGYINGHFQCLHAHCEHRSDQEFLDAIGYVNESVASEFDAIADAGVAAASEFGEEAPATGGGGTDPAGAGKAAGRFTFLPAHEFAASGGQQRWLIKGLLPQAGMGVIFGESGSGKSFVTLDMLTDLAAGTPWRGMKTRQCRVAYVAAEGQQGVKNRLKAIAQARGIELSELAMKVLPDAPNLMEKQDALDLAKAIVAAGGADIVVLDTFAQTTPGANENSGEDMGRALMHCKGIHRATGALVLLVHHSGKDMSRGARGWSGIRGAADVMLEVNAPEGSERRSVYVYKQKDGEQGAEYQFRLSEVLIGMDEEGDDITSCVVEHTEGKGPVRGKGKGKPKRLGDVEQLVLDQFDGLAGLADGAVDVTQLKNACVAQLLKDPNTKRDRRRELVGRSMDGLVAGGLLRVNGTSLVRVR